MKEMKKEKKRAAKVKSLHEYIASHFKDLKIERFTYRGQNMAVDPTLTVIVAHRAIQWMEERKKGE